MNRNFICRESFFLPFLPELSLMQSNFEGIYQHSLLAKRVLLISGNNFFPTSLPLILKTMGKCLCPEECDSRKKTHVTPGCNFTQLTLLAKDITEWVTFKLKNKSASLGTKSRIT